MSPEHDDQPGTRAIDLEIEVPGTPEEVWEAVASGPGITAWFVPAKVDGRVGGRSSSTSARATGPRRPGSPPGSRPTASWPR